MNASQARRLSIKAASENERKIHAAEETRLRSERLRKSEERRKFASEFLSTLRSYIRSAVSDGKRSTEKTLHEYTGGGQCHPLDPKGYLDNYEFGPQVREVLGILAADKYKWEIVGRSVQHDESAAYMNSGGECGSMTPWWSYDTVLRIWW